MQQIMWKWEEETKTGWIAKALIVSKKNKHGGIMISNSNFDSGYYKRIVVKEHDAGLEI